MLKPTSLGVCCAEDSLYCLSLDVRSDKGQFKRYVESCLMRTFPPEISGLNAVRSGDCKPDHHLWSTNDKNARSLKVKERHTSGLQILTINCIFRWWTLTAISWNFCIKKFRKKQTKLVITTMLFKGVTLRQIVWSWKTRATLWLPDWSTQQN